MQDLLNYLKASELWESAFDQGFQPVDSEYQDYNLNFIDQPVTICLMFDIDKNGIILLIEDINNGAIIEKKEMQVCWNEDKSLIPYLQMFEALQKEGWKC